MSPELSVILILLFLLCGIIIATISSSLGIGGGVFSFPLLYYTGKQFLPEQHLVLMSIGGSLIMAVLFSASASWKNHNYAQIRYKHALALLSGSLPGSLLATNWAIQLNKDYLLVAFAIFLLLNGLFGLLRILKIRKHSKQYPNRTQLLARKLELSNILLLWAAGVLIGIASAISGIGGGVLMVPLLLNHMRLDPREAISTSTFCILWITLVGTLGYQYQAWQISVKLPDPRLGFLYLPLVAPLLVGGILGGYAGSVLGKRLSPIILRFVLALLQIVVSLKMLTDFIIFNY